MEWTQTPPTEKGYYFLYDPEDDEPMWIVRVKSYRLTGLAYERFLLYQIPGDDYIFTPGEDESKDAWWLGPIELPVPPRLPDKRTNVLEGERGE